MVTKLAASGLVPEDLGAYPVKPISMAHIPGFLIPYHDPMMYRIRYDRLVDKYIGPRGRTGVWWSPHDDVDLFRFSPTLYIVEGELKAAALRKRFPGTNVLGIGGCWMFMDKSTPGVEKLMPDILRAVRPGQMVSVIFDGDIEEKISIQQAAHALSGMLDLQGVSTQLFKPPLGKGVDDWLVADPLATLDQLSPISIANLEISRKNLYKKLKLKLNEKGNIILNELNGSRLLQDYYNGNAFKDRRLGYIYNGERREGDLTSVSLTYLQDYISGHWPRGVVQYATEMVFQTDERDIVRDLIMNTPWDGTPRLDTWGREYFECDWPEYAAEWGRLLITGLGLRVLRPGTKVDHCCILVGAQGIGKSTFFEELSHFGGFNFYYACTALTSSEGDQARTQGTAFKKSIVVDLAEGVVFNNRKTNTDILKQIISQVEDEYREVFSKSNVVIPRGFVFVGTTNRRDQLSDLTGSRRFLNLEVTKITKLPYEMKLQLLAEVVAKEAAIRASEWYKLNVDINTAPEALRIEHEHIEDSQLLMNTQFHKPETIVDNIIDVLDAGDAAGAIIRSGMHMFVTPGYLATKLGLQGPQSTNLVSRMLAQLSSSPTCKYTIAIHRLRTPQLTFTNPQQKEVYLGQYTDSKRMLSGYICQLKTVHPVRGSETL